MKKSLIALVIAGLALVGFTQAPAQAQTSETTRITLSGTGTVSVKRDQATSNLSVSATESTAKAAMASATRSFNAVRAAVLEAGAKEDDLTTSGLSLYPEYDYSDGRTPRITGYRATISLTVTTPLRLAAAIIDTAVETGGDNVSIGGISFDASNADAVSGTARSRAVANAKAKASAYAKEFDMRVGKAVKIVEVSAPTPQPIYAAADKAMASGITLDPGSARVSVTVEVTFILLD